MNHRGTRSETCHLQFRTLLNYLFPSASLSGTKLPAGDRGALRASAVVAACSTSLWTLHLPGFFHRRHAVTRSLFKGLSPSTRRRKNAMSTVRTQRCKQPHERISVGVLPAPLFHQTLQSIIHKQEISIESFIQIMS